MTGACGRVRDRLDSYLDGELSPEESSSVQGHVAECPECAAELERRRRLRRELAAALDVAGDFGPLEGRILAAIAADRPRSWRPALAWGAALAAAVVVAVVSLRLPRPTSGPSPSTSAPAGAIRVDASIYEDTRDAHLLCALGGRYPSPLRPELATERLGAYAALWVATAPEVPGVTLLEAHVCPRGPRRYGHVILRRGEHVVSVLATADRLGRLPEEGILLRAPDLATPVRALERGGFRLAAAEDDAHAAFVVSDLGPSENAAMGARILARVLGVPW